MSDRVAEHPTPEQLHGFAQGRLSGPQAAAVEEHVAGCESCCLLLESLPADSFEERLRGAERAAFATTTDGSSQTLADAPGVPPELADHPKYRVLALVGQGGMGAVYKAEHRRMDRPVALKVINPALLRNPATVSRFQQEARAAAKLSHPNIVTAHDADQAGDLHFLVMEFVEGTSLAEVVQRGPLPVAEACGYVRQAALGLQHAHERGMVHRDIKPHNLMLTPGGVVKILDFGLARFAQQSEELPAGDTSLSAGLTGAGAVMGTADYIAPEQAADARAADIRADIYSLGCTLYHLLTGRPPFPTGTNVEKFKHHAEAPLPIPAEWSEELKAVLRKMTAKKPEDRYATPAEVVAALEPLTQVAEPKPSRPRPRRRWLVAAALLFFVGLVTAAAAVVIIHIRSQDGREIVVTIDDENLEIVHKKGGQIVRIRDPKSSQTWELDAKNLTLRDLEHPDGFKITLDGRGDLTFKSSGGKVTVTTGPKGIGPPAEAPKSVRVTDPVELAKLPNAADALKSADIPKIARAYLGRGDPDEIPPELVAVLGDVRFRVSASHRSMAITISRDGKQLALANDNDEIRFFDTQTGRLVRQITSPDAPRENMAFSPDGRQLAGIRGGVFAVIDAETGRLAWKREPTGAAVEYFAFSADGKTVVLSTDHGPKGMPVPSLEKWDAVTGKQTKYVWPGDRRRHFAISPDGKKSVEIVGAELLIRDLSAFDEPQRLDFSDRRRVAFSPDGKHFAVARDSKLQKVVEPVGPLVTIHDATGKVLHNLQGQGDEALAFTPDGKTLVTVGIDETVHISRWEVATGKKLDSWPPLGVKGLWDLVLSPDGETVAILRNELQVELYDTATGKPRHTNTGPASAVKALAFSPDGKYLASSDHISTRLWDLSTAKQVAKLDHGDAPVVGGTAFSPDAKTLAVSVDNWIRLIRVADGVVVQKLKVDTARVDVLTFSPDGSLLAAVCPSEDRLLGRIPVGRPPVVRVWSTADGKEQWLLSYPTAVSALLFSPNGSKLYASGYTGIKGWDVQTGKEISHVTPRQTVHAMEWGREGTWMATLQDDGFHFMETEPGVSLFRARKVPETKGFLPCVFGPGGHLFAESDARGFVLSVPDVNPVPRKAFRVFPARDPNGPYQLPGAFGPEGRYFATTNTEGVIFLYRLSEKGKLPELQVTAPTVRELADRPNAADALKHADVTEAERRFVAGGDAGNAPKELVGVLGETRFRVPPGGQLSHARALRYSPDGKLLAAHTSANGFVDIYDVATGRVLLAFHGRNPIAGLAFAPDNRRVAVSTSAGVEIWDVHDGKQFRDFPNKIDLMAPLEPVAFSPDGKTLAGVRSHTSIRLLDADSGTERELCVLPKRPLFGEIGNAAVNRLHFAPDGKKLVVERDRSDRAKDEAVEIVDTTTGKLLPTPLPKASRIWFRPDGEVRAVRTEQQLVPFDAKGKPQEGISIYGEDQFLTSADGFVFLHWESHALHQLTIRRGPLDDHRKVSQITVSLSGKPTCWAVAPDGKTLAVAVDGRLIRFFDLVPTKPVPPPQPLLDPDGKPIPGSKVWLFANEFRDDHLQPGHTKQLKAVAWSADGTRLATADESKVMVWNVAKKEVWRVFDQLLYVRNTQALAFSPDGTGLVISYGQDEPQVELWHLADNKQGPEARGHRFKGHAKPVTHLAFSPDGALLATASKDHTVRLHRAKDGAPVRALALDAEVQSVTFTPSGAHLITREHGGKMRVWDAQTGTSVRLWQAKPDRAYVGETFLPDGRTVRVLAHAGAGVSFQDWDWTTGQLVREELVEAQKQGLANYPPTFAPGGRFLAFAEERSGNSLVVRDTNSDRQKLLLPPDKDDHRGAWNPLFSPDGRYLVTSGPDGLVAIFRLADRGQLPEVRPLNDPEELAKRPNAADVLKPTDVSEIARAYVGGGDPKQAPTDLVAVLGETRFRFATTARQPVFSPDGKLLAVPTELGAVVYDATTGRFVRLMDRSEPEKRVGDRLLWQVKFSPDGRSLAGAYGNEVRFWEVESGRLVRRFRGAKTRDQDGLRYLAFSSDGKRLAAGSHHAPFVWLWNTAGEAVGSRLFTGPDNAHDVRDVAFGPDDQLFAVTQNARIVLAQTDPEKPVVEKESGSRLAFSPDGMHRAVAPNQLRVTNAKGERVWSKANTGSRLLAFADRGNVLVTVSEGRDGPRVDRWDAATGKELSSVILKTVGKELGPVDSPKIHFTVSPDGKTLAVVSASSQLVQLFDTATGEPRHSESGHVQAVRALAFSPDGKFLASATPGDLIVWNLATGNPIGGWGVPETEPIQTLTFSPDGNTVAYAKRIQTQTHILLLDVRAEKHLTVSIFASPDCELAFSPDGQWLACSDEDVVRILRRDSKDGKPAMVLPHFGRIDVLRFHPTGRFLAAGGANGITIWDWPSGREIRARQTGTPRDIEFRPDGQTLVQLVGNRTVDLVNWTDPLTFRRVQYPDLICFDRTLSPAGHLAALQGLDDGVTMLWQPDYQAQGKGDHRTRTLRLSPSGRSGPVAFSSDGRYVAVSDAAGVISVLRLAERGQVPALPGAEVTPLPRPAK